MADGSATIAKRNSRRLFNRLRFLSVALSSMSSDALFNHEQKPQTKRKYKMVFFHFSYYKKNENVDNGDWPSLYPCSFGVNSENYMEGLFKILSLAELEGGFNPKTDMLYVYQNAYTGDMYMPVILNHFCLQDPMAPFRKEAENGQG